MAFNKLSELEPYWIRLITPVTNPPQYEPTTADMADGILLLCPKCRALQERAGTHALVLWGHHVPHEVRPNGGRWGWTGPDWDHLTLDKTIKLNGGCEAHFGIVDGTIQHVDTGSVHAGG